MKELTIVTRKSALAMWQARHIKDQIEQRFGDISVKLLPISSKGDEVLDKPLALIGGKGHFTKALEDVMLEGKAQMAVHSLKDVPTFIPKGLALAAITKREDQSDVLLSHHFASLEALPEGAVVGTTSLRRRMQLLALRPDLRVKELRGNVNTRLKKLAEGEYDAIILARIGLERLELLDEIPYVFTLYDFIPPMGQAALGIEIVADDALAKRVALALNDQDTALLTTIEREFIATIGAGCSAPVAVNATMQEGTVSVHAMVGYSDGTHILQESLSAPKEQAMSLGKRLATCMIDKGAIEVLKEAERIAYKEDRVQRL